MSAHQVPAARELTRFLHEALFSGVDERLLEETVGRDLGRCMLGAGEGLFHQGDPSDAMFLVLAGRLEARITDEAGSEAAVGTIERGEAVGEIQALSGGARIASVRALEDTELLVLPRTALVRLVQVAPQASLPLTLSATRRLRRNQLLKTLRRILGSLESQALDDFERAVEWVRLERGGTLFRQGEPSGAAYLVLSGRLRVFVASPGGEERAVSEITSGETVGEMSLLTGEPRSATVRAVRCSHLARLDQATFDRLVDAHPALLRRVAQLVIRRLQRVQGAQPDPPEPRTLAILSCSAEVTLAPFVERLVRALSEHGRTAHVSAAGLEEALRTPGLARASADEPGAIRLDAWLDEREAHHRFLVLEGDAGMPEWDMRCIERADEVLLVGWAAADPLPSPVECLLPLDRACGARQVLVLLHPDGASAPSGTKRWLEGRRVERHHHVRLDRDGDVQRLARFVAGRAVGIALGGGGARGFAHIGVLRALAEAGVEVDLIGGTSMGGVVAAEHALGWPEAEMLTKTRRLFESWLSDVTLPIVSLLGGHRTARRLRECIPDVQIEDLWLPCFCVSSNLTRADIVVHRQGSLRTAIRASAGLPGILPPVVVGGDLLVDGAFLRNLPVDVVRELSGASAVIAVDVSAPVDLAENFWEGDSLSGWRVLWRRLSPFGERLRMPNIATILLRAGEVAGVAAQRQMLDTAGLLYWRIPVDRFGLLDFRSAREIAEQGYRSARERIAAWKASDG